jgi:predicted adenylyl cyclase CyaB
VALPQRNVEIKARARDAPRQRALAQELAQGEPEVIDQQDTFFRVARGRLKLRVFGDGTGELIYYERRDATEASVSEYLLSPTADPESLRATLSAALGLRAIVRKRRTLYRCGRTRIHLDRVEGLGDYLELEVVLRGDQSAAEGAKIARQIMDRLEVRDADLVDVAYVDLLEATGASGVG